MFVKVADILKAHPKIFDFLDESEKYYAHINSGYNPELLVEHIDLVSKYFSTIISNQNIDIVIDNLITEYIVVSENAEFNIEIGNFLKSIFCNSIIFHDYGKINENFQSDKDKMNNPNFGFSQNI